MLLTGSPTSVQAHSLCLGPGLQEEQACRAFWPACPWQPILGTVPDPHCHPWACVATPGPEEVWGVPCGHSEERYCPGSVKPRVIQG